MPGVASGKAPAYVGRADSAKATGTGVTQWSERKRMFGAILSPHRQLQIAHMASVSESMPLSTEAETMPCFGSKSKKA